MNIYVKCKIAHCASVLLNSILLFNLLHTREDRRLKLKGGGVVPTGFDEEKHHFFLTVKKIRLTKTTRALRPDKLSETKCQKNKLFF